MAATKKIALSFLPFMLVIAGLIGLFPSLANAFAFDTYRYDFEDPYYEEWYPIKISKTHFDRPGQSAKVKFPEGDNAFKVKVANPKVCKYSKGRIYAKGKGYTTVKFIREYGGRTYQQFGISVGKGYKITKVVVDQKARYYDGYDSHFPKISVYSGKKKLKYFQYKEYRSGEYDEVAPEDAIVPGTYKITVKGNNGYVGSASTSFKVAMASPEILSVKSSSATGYPYIGITAKYRVRDPGGWDSKGYSRFSAIYYEIQYSKKPSMKGAVTETVTSFGTDPKKVGKNLYKGTEQLLDVERGATYYVRIRPYVKPSRFFIPSEGAGYVTIGRKFYGSWTSVSAVTVAE